MTGPSLRARVAFFLVVLAFVSASWWAGYTFTGRTVDVTACEAALRVGMGDSGAAEVAAIKSPACRPLSDDELAAARARVETRLVRESPA